MEAYQNTNVEELIFRGVELNGDLMLTDGFSVGGNYTWVDSQDALNKDPFYGVRKGAAVALAHMHTDEAFEALTESMDQSDARVRLTVVELIGEEPIGPEPRTGPRPRRW